MRVPRRLSMTRRNEFAAVRPNGESVGCRHFVMATLADPAIEHLTVGLIPSRRARKAVHRNKIRRPLRSILRKPGAQL